MIIESLFNIVRTLYTFVFNLLPNFPQISSDISSSVTNFFNIVFDNVGLLDLFVSVELIKILVPLILIVWNFDKLYKIIMYILRKIPFIDIE